MYDPLRHKEVADTPEERVRQWFIGELINIFHVPAHMMMSETGFLFGSKPFRADILIYNRSGEPMAVVECKRPDVKIDASVVEQAMRYEAALNLKIIFLTNGNFTYLYIRKGDKFVPCTEPLDFEKMLCLP
ncbi:MAG: type I restriction enzyme HsdR N-terminal domain-containing protein [Bacteroidales bacterium]|nr:type I restriction enzyme HsdR N-terminal domain-containing protein [Bacteroidales bacterium]